MTDHNDYIDKPSKTMKLYYATGVMCDYICGAVVIMAESKEQAMKLLENEYEYAHRSVGVTGLEEWPLDESGILVVVEGGG